MVDPTGLVGLVFNVAHLTANALQYVDSLSHAQDLKNRLKADLIFASGVIETLRFLRQAAPQGASWLTEIDKLEAPNGLLPTYQASLREMDGMMVPTTRRHPFTQKLENALHLVRWPTKETKIDARLRRIMQHKQDFQLVLQNVQAQMGLEMQHVMESGTQDLSRLAATTFSKTTNREIKRCCKWLSASDVRPKLQNLIQKGCKSTPEWFFHTQAFNDWQLPQSDNQRVLLVSGHPGAGKTHLTALIVKHSNQSHKAKGLGSEQATAIFFCSHANEQETSENLLRVISRQALEQVEARSSQLQIIKSALTMKMAHPSSSQPPDAEDEKTQVDSLIQDAIFQCGTLAVLECLLTSFGKAFIIVDALDEIQEVMRKDVLSELHRLLSSCPNLRILFTSRSGALKADQLRPFSNFIQFEFVPRQDDIKAFVEAQISRFVSEYHGAFSSLSNTQISSIQSMIISKSHQTFLIAERHLEALRSCRTSKALLFRAGRLNADLSQTVDAAVQRIRGLGEDMAVIGMRTLLWTVHAKRPLTIHELSCILATYDSYDELDMDESTFLGEQDILSCCEGLIMIDANTKAVSMHKSLQEYFETEQRPGKIFPRAAFEMADICLRYLSFLPSASTLGRNLEGRACALEAYTAQYWVYHARDSSDPEMLMRMKKLWRKPRAWERALVGLRQGSLTVDDDEAHEWLFEVAPSDRKASARPDIPDLHLAAFLGLDELARVSLERGLDPDLKHKGCITALHVAAYTGNYTTVSMLLDFGADVKLVDHNQCTSLHLAARSGSAEAVKRLVRFYEILNSRNAMGFTAVHEAVKRRHMGALEALAASGADLTITDALIGWAPIHHAAAAGNIAAIRLLHEVGGPAVIEQPDGGRWKDRPLHVAVSRMRRDSTLELIRLGADIESRQMSGQPASHLAAEHGSVDCLDTLIQHGIDLTSKDDYGLTIMHKAARSPGWNGPKVLRLLIPRCANLGLINKLCDANHTPLHNAAIGGLRDNFELLIQNGANVEALTGNHENVLHIAAFHGHADVVKLLTQHQSWSILQTQKNTEDQTPLNVAMQRGQSLIAECLLNLSSSG